MTRGATFYKLRSGRALLATVRTWGLTWTVGNPTGGLRGDKGNDLACVLKRSLWLCGDKTEGERMQGETSSGRSQLNRG